jgi:hypothetical protein
MAKSKQSAPKIPKSRRRAAAEPREPGEGDPWGDQELYGKNRSEGTYTPQETGRVDEPIPEPDNPQGVQSGRGPLGQEGEGDRQNDHLAELEEEEIDLKDDANRPDEDV